ncbi:hypothetical protein SAMN05421878_10740 [Actinobaculum suis]|uniref:Uncharacterized protein n=1 Tax=Actinobaculum suis TaxID=1657 RepID=A0A1G7CB07_9ACTO|nr:hypothetical protein SAMN05421878_10740 [Actinobaculum suis]
MCIGYPHVQMGAAAAGARRWAPAGLPVSVPAYRCPCLCLPTDARVCACAGACVCAGLAVPMFVAAPLRHLCSCLHVRAVGGVAGRAGLRRGGPGEAGNYFYEESD